MINWLGKAFFVFILLSIAVLLKNPVVQYYNWLDKIGNKVWQKL